MVMRCKRCGWLVVSKVEGGCMRGGSNCREMANIISI